MKLIKLTHANLNTSIYLAADLVAGFYASEAHKATHVVATGGAVFPAAESVDEVRALLEEGRQYAVTDTKLS